MHSRGKPARAYVAEIIVMDSREARVDALAKVPEDMRELVKHMVVCHFELKKSRK